MIRFYSKKTPAEFFEQRHAKYGKDVKDLCPLRWLKFKTEKLHLAIRAKCRPEIGITLRVLEVIGFDGRRPGTYVACSYRIGDFQALNEKLYSLVQKGFLSADQMVVILTKWSFCADKLEQLTARYTLELGWYEI